jgi:hypothetical protein
MVALKICLTVVLDQKVVWVGGNKRVVFCLLVWMGFYSMHGNFIRKRLAS